MNITRLHELLQETTVLLRKGAVVEHKSVGPGVDVVTVDMMPHVDEVRPGVTVIDLELVAVGVAPDAAAHKAELIELLESYHAPARLRAGPSYIEVGADIGDQGAAFQLFALGAALGLWEIITPAKMGFEGEKAKALAGRGFIFITGFKGDQPHKEDSHAV